MISLVAAYVVYRGFAWVNWNLTYGEAVPLDSGTLFERAAALARKARVPLARLSLLKTRVPEEANAFATSGDAVVLTTSLVNGLTEREVDAVIAHELGHHKSGHLRVNYATILFWVYVLLAGPLYGWLLARYEIPSWVVTLPIVPVVFTLAQGLLSQRHEYTADARAVEITGDPEGKIAALGRLAQLSRVPVQSGGIMDSIMSHPSMQRRVLALARRHGMVDGRALDILRNPDLAYSDPPPTCRAEAPAQVPSVEAVFTVRGRVLFCEQLRWIKLLTTLGATVPSVLRYRHHSISPREFSYLSCSAPLRPSH
jgi:hypothetical protein